MKGWEGGKRDWGYISTFFREEPGGCAAELIDDRTWDDLDLGDVFRLLDRTRSSVGQAALFRLMRTPLEDAVFRTRTAKISALIEDETGRVRASRILGRLGFQRDGEIYGFLSYVSMTIREDRRFIFPVLGVLAALSALAPAFLGLPGLAVTVGIVLVNFIVHYSCKAKVETESPSFAYLHRLLTAAERLSRLGIPALQSEISGLRALVPGLRRLRSRTRFLFGSGGLAMDVMGMLSEYIKIMFLLEVTAYYFSHNEMISRMADLKSAYRIVGEIDAVTAIAAFRAESGACITPELEAGKRLLDAQGVIHPLLPDAVPNSIRLDGKGVIVTGSNMSGKSTFLRTLGVNQVLASTLCTVFARSYRSSFFLTVSSITSRDSLRRAESRYLSEAKRMLFILKCVKDGLPVLAIIDEILSGTNSEERIAASIRLLRAVAGGAGLVVAATHDREIAAALDGAYANSHFTHEIGEAAAPAASGSPVGALEFDYVLRNGIVERGNAIRLLAHIGFPPEITGVTDPKTRTSGPAGT